ncbi:MAG: acyl-CoA thioesterase [Candidatus Sericytochromatia bacterium]|nr:acyl-CoA thioesterase [Candidatus Sericytochromatia bacterium]
MLGANDQPAIRVKMLPKDTNEMGTIFGGVILSQIDLAAAVEAAKHTSNRIATVAMREIVFREPVYVGDTVSFFTKLIKLGRTSITIRVVVEARRRTNPNLHVIVTDAEAIFVSLDDTGRPTPLGPSPLVGEPHVPPID